jgi:hypothetical protein
MKKKIAILMMAAVMMISATGCVKVVKIGEESSLTGKTDFSASDNVSDLWESAQEDIEGRAVDLGDFLTEANGDLILYGNFRQHQLSCKGYRNCRGSKPGEKSRIYDSEAGWI